MKNNSILMFAFLIVFALAANSASAQITITIPKIPKIKKPKIEQPTTTTTDGKQTERGQSSEKTSSAQVSTDDDEMDFRLKFFLDEIAKTQKGVDKYDPDEHIYLVGGAESEWLLRAISMREREKWGKEWLKKPNEQRKFAAALDTLSASAAKKLPIYIPNANNFAFHNAVEEKMMKAALKNPAALKIHKIGLFHSTWQISKDDYNLPTARYKQGFIWARDPADDYSYCHLYQVNIIQDYAGGGTYAASYARFLGDTIFGCPAGAK